MNIIVIYGGRFHPFHKGHAQVYQWLKNKFGSTYVATSGVVEPPKSPFTFAEKKKMMTLAGVSSKDIQQVKNPYRPDEILKAHDPKKTAVVFAVSEKDMAEDPRFKFSAKSYLQPLPKDTSKLEGYGSKGYIVTTPTFPFTVLGHKMKDASQIRDLFAESDTQTQKELVADLFGKYDDGVYKIMASKIKTTKKSVKQLKEDISRKEFGPMLDSFVSFACDHLKLDDKPKIILKAAKEQDSSFGGYFPGTKELQVVTKNRHPMDVFRTVAHELIHHKQNLEGRIKDAAKEGATGSEIENEANALAGVIMRDFARNNPSSFGLSAISENYKAIFVVGGSGSGKDYVLKQTLGHLHLEEVRLEKLFSHLLRSDIAPNHMIINGGADDYTAIKEAKELIESCGYNTHMLFVNTSNIVSKLRNDLRSLKPGARMVQESIRQDKWNKTQENMNKLAELFGSNFMVFNNDIDVNTTDGMIREEFESNLRSLQDSLVLFIEGKDLNTDFEEYMVDPSNREMGTKSLSDIYAKVTPGQYPIPEKADMKKVKTVLRKKLAQEAESPTSRKLPIGGGLGPEITLTSVAESIKSWAENPATQARFVEKYGDNATTKLEEAVKSLQEAGMGIKSTGKKTISQLRQARKQ